MLRLLVYALCAVAYCRSVEDHRQRLLTLAGPTQNSLDGTIVRLCAESNDTDILSIERMVNRPRLPILNEEIDVFIWGNLSRNISASSTVDYQINVTANNGESGSLNGTFHICDYLEKMHQPPDSNVPEKACPPSKGPIFIDYAFWFVDWLVAPGQWSIKFDAKSADGHRIYCLETEFDLQCPPERDDPKCMRNTTATPTTSVIQRSKQTRTGDV